MSGRAPIRRNAAAQASIEGPCATLLPSLAHFESVRAGVLAVGESTARQELAQQPLRESRSAAAPGSNTNHGNDGAYKRFGATRRGASAPAHGSAGSARTV